MVNPPRNTWDTLAYGLQGMSQAMNNFANVMQTQQAALQESHDREMQMAYALATSQRDLQWMLQAGAPQTPAGSTVPVPHSALNEEHAEEGHSGTHTEHHEHADEEHEEDELLEADDGGSNTQHHEDGEGPQKKKTRMRVKTTVDPKKKRRRRRIPAEDNGEQCAKKQS